MQAKFGAVPFQDASKAAANVARLDKKLAPKLMAPLASLLTLSPDPDGALNLLERYVEAAPPEVLRDLARHPTALTYLVAIFGYSGSLAEAFLGDPAMAIQFARDRHFAKLKSREDLMQDYARFATTSPDPWLAAQLAGFKRRNYLRLVLKDVLRLSTLAETTLELSALADVTLANALAYCDQELVKRYGQPQYRDVQGRIVRSGFSVISLGKLGGDELNYSSDIDLLFLYSHDGETAGGSERDSLISNKEYFVRLAHAITRTITQPTPAGHVFRVDLRLRPEGEEGDLTISLRSALEYYEHRARDWELQMLIKARHSAGDPWLTREFLRGVEPYVYGSPTDFAAVESVLWAREKTSKKLRESRADSIDVKRHRGGIRDIEFLTQCLQRLYGGRDPWVRSGGTLHALRKLNDKGMIFDRDYAALTGTYEFLRKVEHRIQLDLGQQTHRLPVDPEALDRLGRRVGVEPEPNESPGSALLRQLRQAFAYVDGIYQRAIHPASSRKSEQDFELKPLAGPSASHGPHSYESTLYFLDSQAPELAEVVRQAELPDRTRPNVARFFGALLASSERFALARQRPSSVRQALEALGASGYLAELLIRHPEDLAILDSALSVPYDEAWQLPIHFDHLERPGSEPAIAGRPFPWVAASTLDGREKMAALGREYRSQTLALGAQDCAALDSLFASLHRWSTVASRSIASALAIAAGPLGTAPALAGAVAPAGSSFETNGHASLPFVVLALGRLGLNEFDLASDADLIFVSDPGVPRDPSGPADDVGFWAHLAEKTIETLSSYTSDGTVFAVDTRLRPRGQEGDLVVTSDTLVGYMHDAAQPWEALTYLKARPVAGNLELGRQVVSRLTDTLFERFSTCSKLEGELQQMRRRLERELDVRPTDTKTAPGGYYDIDFAVSYLRLRHRIDLPAGANAPEQIGALRAANLVSEEDAAVLTRGAVFLRSVDHAIRLVTGKPARGFPEHVGHAEAVENLAWRWGLVGEAESLTGRLRDVQQQVRYVYRRLVGSE